MNSQYLNDNIRNFYLKNRGIILPEEGEVNLTNELDSALSDIRANERTLESLYIEATKLSAENSTLEYDISILRAIRKYSVRSKKPEVTAQIKSGKEEYKSTSEEIANLMKTIAATERNIYDLNLKVRTCEFEISKICNNARFDKSTKCKITKTVSQVNIYWGGEGSLPDSAGHGHIAIVRLADFKFILGYVRLPESEGGRVLIDRSRGIING